MIDVKALSCFCGCVAILCFILLTSLFVQLLFIAYFHYSLFVVHQKISNNEDYAGL